MSSKDKIREAVIFVFCQSKGGVGKTTLSFNVTIELAREGHDVLLVDADEQQTATDATAVRADQLGGNVGYTAVSLSGVNVRTQILAMKNKYDYIVVDVGGRDTAALRAALTVATIAVCPFLPRSFDVWTLGKMEALITEARLINPDMVAVAMINGADAQGSDNLEAAEALKDNKEIRFLDATIGRRKAFPNAASIGQAVTEPKRRDGQAAAELQFLVQELVELAGGQQGA